MSLKKNFIRTKNKHCSKEKEKQGLSVFGYSCRLYEEPECNKRNPKSAEEPGGHSYLISWNGDEAVKIDRYDCRLYLNSLDEFDRSKSENGTKHGMDEAEGMEEEMCEEERYLDMDMYVDMRKTEEDKEFQRGNRAEFAFNYDSKPFEMPIKSEESSSSEEEIEEKYEIPEGLKLPVGIDLPETMKHSTVIEKTAMFVVQQGPQMEVVIKAKQRNNIQQFGFLEFDDRLNPFYKYICKLIREKKYTPVPHVTKTRPKPKKLRRLPAQAILEETIINEDKVNAHKIRSLKPSSALEMIAFENRSGTDGSGDSEEEGYLHPLLVSSSSKNLHQSVKSKRPTPSRRLSKAPKIFGPMPQPEVKQIIPVRPVAPNFDEILRQHHINSQTNEDNIYSSLFKNLNSLLPGAKARAEEEELQKKKESEEKAKKEVLLETDEEKIRDYVDWHMEFYGRPSPYLPSAHPIALPPPPNLSSALSIASRYVAMNGGTAEQKLIDHNGESCEFLFPRSPYYTYYQMRVRYNQWMMNQTYLAVAAAKQHCQQSNFNETGDPTDDIVFASTSSCTFPQPPRPPNGLNSDSNIAPTELPLFCNSSSDVHLENEPDMDNVEAALKMERKEKARLFMEKILNEKLAAKKRAQDCDLEIASVGSKFVPKEANISGKVAALPPPTLLTSDTISSLIDQQIQRVFKGYSPTPASKNVEKIKKEKTPKKDLKENLDRSRKKRSSAIDSDEGAYSSSSSSSRRRKRKERRRDKSQSPALKKSSKNIYSSSRRRRLRSNSSRRSRSRQYSSRHRRSRSRS